MPAQTKPLFLNDSYLPVCQAKVLEINDKNGIILDQTVFYATSGGQPGDSGHLEFENGAKCQIATTVTGSSKAEIVHVPADGELLPEVGDTVYAHIDWPRRYRLMQMHTACHLLSVICPFPITSANVGETESRVDFDIPDFQMTKPEIYARLMELVHANHAVTSSWITEVELDADPSIIKSKNVRPPRGLGDIRIVLIGTDASVDSQPCGGTHVSETGEIGAIHVGKIENKGRENRRFRLRFGELPS